MAVLALGGAYFLDLLRTLLALAAVCLLVWFALRALAARGFGGAAGPNASLRVVRRIALDARKSLYVVRAGKRVLLIGSGDSGPPSLLTELDAASFESDEPAKEAAGNPGA